MGEICRRIERVGKGVFVDSPARWFAWADKQGPEHVQIHDPVPDMLSLPGEARPETKAFEDDEKPTITHSGLPGRPKEDKGSLTPTQEKYESWYWLSQKLQADHPNKDQGYIVYLISLEVPEHAKGWSNQNIKRRLNEFYRGWFDPNKAKEIWAEKVGQNSAQHN